MKRLVTYFFLGSFLLIFSCKRPADTVYIKRTGQVFGTTYGISYSDSKNYQKQFDSLFTAVNESLSTYIPTSDISKINKGDSTVVIDEYFKEVMQKSKRIFKETDGYFDPTVGNLVNAWGFGPKNEMNNLTENEVEELMQYVGFDKVLVKANKIKKQHPTIYLDFNSIAKGYGIDVIARFLESKNVENYLVEIGGEIRAKGLSSSQKPWRALIQNPKINNSNYDFEHYINLSGSSMATSGNYRKFRVTEDGRKYVHTINPKTGFARESNLLSTSVIAKKDCADVDAYATAFMAMGLEKTKEFLKSHPDIKVFLIYEDKNGELISFTNITKKRIDYFL